MIRTKLLSILAVLLLPTLLFSQIVQWRGPNRDGIFPETNLLKAWPQAGPEKLQVIDGVGKGWSSVVVSNNMMYVTGMIDTMDCLSAIDPAGKIVWQTAYGRAWDQSFPDTRSTPTIENNRAYISSGVGEVVCVDLSTGKLLWKKNTFAENEGSVGTWGVAESILLLDNKVFFTTGGSKTMMVALDKNTGETLWKSKSLNDGIAYVSPIVIEMNGKKQIINIGAKYIFGIDPENGAIAWSFDYLDLDPSEWENQGGVINCTSPLFKDGFLYVTSGYNHTGAKFKMKEDLSGIDLLWKDEVIDNHHGGFVLLDGYIYSSNWVDNTNGNWCSISFDTGKLGYETKFDTKGSIVSADDMLYIYTERQGKVALVKPNSANFEIVGQFRVSEGSGPHWAHPTIDHGKLIIRHGEVVIVYDVKQNP